jgi:hypothetical protein
VGLVETRQTQDCGIMRMVAWDLIRGIVLVKKFSGRNGVKLYGQASNRH